MSGRCNARRLVISTVVLVIPLCISASVAAERTFRDVSFTTSEGTWMSLDVSPDGQTIAFDLLNDIYVMPAEGGIATVIHSGPAVQRSPQFSPDGKILLYLSDETGADNLWISALDGSNPRQLSKETLAMIVGPAWAHDGRSIVASKTNATVHEMSTSEIRRFFVDGAPEQIVVAPPESGKDLQESRLSPEGRYLYYTERRGGDHYVYVNTGLGNFVIRRRDLQTGETVDLIGGFGSATTPQVSPDGQQIAFIRRLGARTVLFRYDVKDGTQHPVYQDLDRDLQGDYIPQEHYYPSFDWFPDNRHVAIWGKGQLYKIDTKTGSASVIPWKESKVRSYIPEVNNAYNPVLGAIQAPLHVRGMQTIHYDDALYDIGFRSVGRSIKRLDDAGVTINVGSHGQASGVAIHWEMQLLAEGGMAPMRILRAATINGARTYGLDHQLGSIEPGKLADLIVLDRDPLSDVRNTNSVRYTMVNGRLYDAESMNEIGNYNRPRTQFWWELGERNGIEWNAAWGTGEY